MKNHPLFQKAQEYLSKGYSVIPVSTNKKPLIKWTEYQTRKAEETEVQQWLQQFPDMQLGIVTGAISDLVVIDVEEGGDHTQFPETLTATTGGNGYHLYYKHPGTPVKNGVKVMELVDIRGDGGYVVAPGSSSTKGAYDWVEEATEPALYTGDMLQSQPEMSLETGELVQTGERNVLATKKAGEILAYMPHAHSRNDTWALLQQWNETEVAEPLPDEELMKVFKSIADRQSTHTTTVSFTLTPFTLRELYAEEFPETEWLVEKLIPLGMMGAITGESSSYKTFITQALAQAVATGELFLGHFPITKGKVLVVDEENNKRIINGRFKAMDVVAHDNISFLARNGLQLDNPVHFATLQRVIAEIKPTLLVLDSLVRFHSKDENSATEMRTVMKKIGELAVKGCTVIFIHHHKKEQGFGKNSGSGSVRGSTDIFNALDYHIGIKRTGNTMQIKQHKLRVEPEMEPFNVELKLEDEKVAFAYEGVDTTRQDMVDETKVIILHMLKEADGEAVGRKDLVTTSNMPQKICTDALKELVEKELIRKQKGERNAHEYVLAGTEETEDSVEEVGN